MNKIIAMSMLALAPALMPALSVAQTATAAAKAEAKPAAKTAAPAAARPAPKKAIQSASRIEINSTANQMASGISASEAALSPEDVKLADRVETGKLPCELGAFVEVQPDPKSPGYFTVITRTARYRMFPVLSRTGAIRLEDKQGSTVWLQLANKSMLMDQKVSKRLADECMSPGQALVAEALKKNPAPSLLDAPVPAPSASAAAAAASGASAAAQPAVAVQPTSPPAASETAAVSAMPGASAPAQPASAAR